MQHAHAPPPDAGIQKVPAAHGAAHDTVHGAADEKQKGRVTFVSHERRRRIRPDVVYIEPPPVVHGKAKRAESPFWPPTESSAPAFGPAGLGRYSGRAGGVRVSHTANLDSWGAD